MRTRPRTGGLDSSEPEPEAGERAQTLAGADECAQELQERVLNRVDRPAGNLVTNQSNTTRTDRLCAHPQSSAVSADRQGHRSGVSSGSNRNARS